MTQVRLAVENNFLSVLAFVPDVCGSGWEREQWSWVQGVQVYPSLGSSVEKNPGKLLKQFLKIWEKTLAVLSRTEGFLTCLSAVQVSKMVIRTLILTLCISWNRPTFALTGSDQNSSVLKC